MDKLYSIEAEVTGRITDGFRLKISEFGIGMYIAGFTARKSVRNTSEWWIQPPATYQKRTGKYVRCPEFDTKTTFWEELLQEVTRAIKEFEAGEEDIAGSNYEEIDTPINLDDIPFGDEEKPKAISWRDPNDL
jgi:hypothetical protein